ncbi:MAG: ParB N-terminal domain-containing protein [Bacteroidales bacterium]
MSEPKSRKVSELKKMPNNPRTIKDEAFKALVNSIQDNPEFFQAKPLILSDRTGELIIIAGNQRYDAARFLGMKVVPTFLISGLTEKKEKEITVRDNVSSGEWDYNILKMDDWKEEPFTDWGVPIGGEPEDFKPNLEPTTSHQQMSKADIDKENTRLAGMFIQNAEYINVICPECYNEFKIRKDERADS